VDEKVSDLIAPTDFAALTPGKALQRNTLTTESKQPVYPSSNGRFNSRKTAEQNCHTGN